MSATPVVIRRPMLLATLAMIGSAASWGAGTVMSKAVIRDIPPVTLLVIQLTASVIVLWLGTLLGRIPFTRRDIRHGWTGILEPGLAYLIGLIGIQFTTASNATLINALEPFLVLVLAFFLFRQRVTRLMMMLMAISVIGVILVSATPAEAAGNTLLGDGLELLATFCAAFYVVLSSQSVAHLHPLPLAALQQTIGLCVALMALPLALALGEAHGLNALTVQVIAFAMLSGVIQYSAAFVLYLTALKSFSAPEAAQYLTLIPVFGMAGAMMFLGETLTLAQLVGAGLIIGTLMLLHRQKA